MPVLQLQRRVVLALAVIMPSLALGTAAQTGSRGVDRTDGRRVEHGCQDRPQHFRAVRRAPRQGHLRGRVGRSRLAHPEHARHSQRRGRGAQGPEGAERALARRLFRRRIPLAQRHRSCCLPSRHAQSELGRRDRAEHVRHARVPGLRRPDRRRGLPVGERRLRHARGSGRLARVPHGRAADGAREGTRRERPAGALQDRDPRDRQRELGLRRQHVRRVLPAANCGSTAASSAISTRRSRRRIGC